MDSSSDNDSELGELGVCSSVVVAKMEHNGRQGVSNCRKYEVRR